MVKKRPYEIEGEEFPQLESFMEQKPPPQGGYVDGENIDENSKEEREGIYALECGNDLISACLRNDEIEQS